MPSPISDVDPARVAAKTIGGIYDGATTQELDRLSIETAPPSSQNTITTRSWAAALLSEYIRKEVANQHIESFSQSIARTTLWVWSANRWRT